METKIFPTKNWAQIRNIIKRIGEGESVSNADEGDNYNFLVDLKIISDESTGELTEIGVRLFEEAFIKVNEQEEKNILTQQLLGYEPTIAIQQYLWGLDNPTISQVLTVLKSTGYWAYDSMSPLTHFLDLLNYCSVATYNRKNKTIKILMSPDSPTVPKSVFIDPNRPFSNIMWLKRILAECTGHIYWLDKHFQKEAFEWIWAIADATKLDTIRILSLDLGEANLNIEARNNYKRLKKELANKGIGLVWATIDSKLIRDAHDRWIIGGNNYVRNVPNVNAITSGQKSELNISDNYLEISQSFEDYWKHSTEVK